MVAHAETAESAQKDTLAPIRATSRPIPSEGTGIASVSSSTLCVMTQGRSRMRECCTYGSVRGAESNLRSYATAPWERWASWQRWPSRHGWFSARHTSSSCQTSWYALTHRIPDRLRGSLRQFPHPLPERAHSLGTELGLDLAPGCYPEAVAQEPAPDSTTDLQGHVMPCKQSSLNRTRSR